MEKEVETIISRENGDSQSRKKNLVNQWVMAYKSNCREDKEVKTERPGTQKLDIKGDRFTKKWGG